MNLMRAAIVSLAVEVAAIVSAFFGVSVIVYVTDPSPGRHLFNSWWIVVGVGAALTLAFIAVRRFALATNAVAGASALATLVPALLVAFGLLVCLCSAFAAPTGRPSDARLDAAARAELQPAVDALVQSLPSNWQLLSVEEVVNPNWSFGDGPSGLAVTVYGPETGYRDFTGGAGDSVRVHFMNEGRTFWVMPHDYSPRWTYLNWTFGVFRLIPIHFPERLGGTDDAVVFGDEAIVILPENEHLDKAPEGHPRASAAVMPSSGGSWPEWQADVRQRLSGDR